MCVLFQHVPLTCHTPITLTHLSPSHSHHTHTHTPVPLTRPSPTPPQPKTIMDARWPEAPPTDDLIIKKNAYFKDARKEFKSRIDKMTKLRSVRTNKYQLSFNY